jgi:hypothetical protein
MILDHGRAAIFIPFSRLRRLNGSFETSGSQDAESTSAAKEDEERFL